MENRINTISNLFYKSSIHTERDIFKTEKSTDNIRWLWNGKQSTGHIVASLILNAMPQN